MKFHLCRQGILLAPFIFGCSLLATFSLSAQEAPPPPPGPSHIEGPANRENPDLQADRTRPRLEEPRRDGRHEDARRMEMRMRKGQPQGMERPRERGARAPRPGVTHAEARGPFVKMMHLKQAAFHLRAAGYEKHADMAQEEIKRAEKQIRDEIGKRMKQADEDRAAKEKKAEKPAGEAKQNQAIEAEIKKMRREMEELRQQVRRLKAEQGTKANRAKPENPAESPPPAAAL